MSVSNAYRGNKYNQFNKLIEFLSNRKDEQKELDLEKDVYKKLISQIIAKEVMDDLNKNISKDVNNMQIQISNNLAKEMCNENFLVSIEGVSGKRKFDKSYIETYKFIKKEVTSNGR
jgi:hypothetical protein